MSKHTEDDDTATAYTVVTEPDGDTSRAIVDVAMHLGPDATNPDVVDAVADEYDIDTSPSWVSRVRNKYLEEVDDPPDDRATVEPAGPDVRKRGMTASPTDADLPGGIDETDIRAIVELVVAEYAAEVEPDIVEIHRSVAELNDAIDRLRTAVEADTFPTDLDEYPEEIRRELKAEILEEKLDEIRSGGGAQKITTNTP